MVDRSGPQPSFVLFMTDQHRADWLGCAGHHVLRTPNIDALARGGTRFTDCFVAHPICMPNRASLITGRMTSVHGVRHNGLSLPLDTNTFVETLRRAGYVTGLIGKGHHQPFTPMTPRMARGSWDTEPGTEARLATDGQAYASERADLWAKDPDHNVDLPYYGYTHADIVSRHGDNTGGAHARWLQTHVPNYKDLIGPDNQLPHDYTRPDAVRTALPEEAYSTSFVRDRAVEFLETHGQGDQPYFLMVSFPDPHHPFTPPGKYWDMYDPADMELPASFAGMNNGTPLYEQLREYEPPPGAFRGALEGVTEQHTREAMALTAGMITMVDDAVGAVGAAIAETGAGDRTVQVFTSDHGDMMGDHAMLLKGPLHLDGVIRVPLLWNDPQQSSVATAAALVSTVDIAPTILARAGVDAYNGMQGCDLAPTLETGAIVRNQLLVEQDAHVPLALTGDLPPRLRTIVTPHWKMNVYLDQDWGELFNRLDDPHECQNLWSDPSAQQVRSEMMFALTQELMRTVDRSPLPVAMG